MSAKEKIRSAYEKNEISANKHMTLALLFTAGLLFAIWFGYFFKVFEVAYDTWKVTVTVIPFLILVLCIPAIFLKSKFLASPKYKYFVLSLFIIAIFALNVIMPKHAVLGWAVCIVLTAHYYNPRLSSITFGVIIFMSLVALGFATFYGEFDSNLLSGELNKADQTIHSIRLTEVYPDTAMGRYKFLKDLIYVAHENRFIKIFTQYFLGRALFLTLIFVVTVFLNKRTKVLLNSEIAFSTENEKNKTELGVAKEIQLNTLPEETLYSEEVEIIGELKAANEVGGDLYDYVNIDEDHVAVLIGDVSGKGVPSAMFMMKTITSFRDFAKAGKTPSQILKDINSSIIKGNKTSMFVTCFLAILDKRSGKVIYANAGHNPPIVGSNFKYRYLECKPGFLLGCFEKVNVVDEEITLLPGESMTLYTDGITEARNINGEFYGEDRLLHTLNRQDYTCILELHHTIKDDISSFVGEAPQSDDITFVTLKYRGDHYVYEEKAFDGRIEHIPEMLKFIEKFSDKYKCPEDFKNKLTIVGDELFSNIINHGYNNNGGVIYVRLLFDMDTKEFVLTIIDMAKEFNQLEVDKPEVGSDVKKQEIGGLGLIIVKKIMDEYAYDRINGKNILVLKKRF